MEFKMKKTVALLLLLVVLSSVCVFADTNQFLRFGIDGGFDYYFIDGETRSSTSLGSSAFVGWENNDFSFSIEAMIHNYGYSTNIAYSRYFNNGLFVGGEFELGVSTGDNLLGIGCIGIFGVRLAGIGRSWMDLGLGLQYDYGKQTAYDETTYEPYESTFSSLSLMLCIEDFCPISDSLTMIFAASVAGIDIFSKATDINGDWASDTTKTFGIALRTALKYSFPAEGFKPHLKTK